jgi:RsiW-degrading membrane proteinase PrsW (M82 family)
VKAAYWIVGPSPNSAAQSSEMVRLESGKQVEIGRAEGCTIRVADQTVSRKHALLTTGTDGEWYLYDLKSSNGTYLNGCEIAAGTRLNPDDVIRLGSNGPALRFKQRAEEPEQKPATGQAVRDSDSRSPARVVSPMFPGGRKAPPPTLSPSLGLSTIFPAYSRGKWRLPQRRHVVLGLIAIVPATLLAMLSALAAAPWVNYATLAIVVFFFVTSSSTALLEVAGRSKPWFAIAAAGLATAFLSAFCLAFDFGREEPFSKALIVHTAVQQFIAAIPIVAGMWIGKRGPLPLRRCFGVFGPLDGLSIGLGSAAGFELVETLAYPLQHPEQTAALNSVIGSLIGDIAGQLALSGYIGCVLGLGVARPNHRFGMFVCAWALTTSLSVSAKSLLQLGKPLDVALSGVLFFAIFALLITSIYRARIVEGLSGPLSSAAGRRS